MNQHEEQLQFHEERLRLEYEETGQSVRQIDTRIWGIYALYLGGVGAATLLTFRDWNTINNLTLFFLSAAIIIASFAKMALIGHLQWSSDILYERLREIECAFGFNSHRRFKKDIPPVRLWGGHRWWYELRARDVMQVLALCIIVFWLLVPLFHQNCTIQKISGKFSVIYLGLISLVSITDLRQLLKNSLEILRT